MPVSGLEDQDHPGAGIPVFRFAFRSVFPQEHAVHAGAAARGGRSICGPEVSGRHRHGLGLSAGTGPEADFRGRVRHPEVLRHLQPRCDCRLFRGPVRRGEAGPTGAGCRFRPVPACLAGLSELLQFSGARAGEEWRSGLLGARAKPASKREEPRSGLPVQMGPGGSFRRFRML